MALAATLLAGCFTPRAQVAARNWRPLGPDGLSLGRLLAVSPGVRNIIWETFAGLDGQTVARASVEYDPVRASADCPGREPGMALAARAFLLLDLVVTPAGRVDFLAAKAQAYNVSGAYEEYGLDAGVIADLVARVRPIPCDDLRLPGYLSHGGGGG